MTRAPNVLDASLRALLNFLPDAAFLVDSTGRLAEVNARAGQIFGYQCHELHGQRIDTLIPERFRGVHFEHGADYFTQPPPRAIGVGLTLRALHKDGTEFPVEISLGPIETEKGTLVLGAIRDLSESEERYRAIFEQVTVGVAHTTLDGQILNVNPRLCELLGYTRKEALALHIRDVTHPDDISKSIDARGQILALDRTGHEREVRLIRKNGAEIWTHIGTSLIRSADGRPVHFISMIHDISEQKRAEDELQRTVAELRRAVHSAVEVVSTIGEVRDPYTHGHEHRVGQFATAIAEEMGLPADFIEGVRVAGYLHDVGKIGVPAQILSKPTRLSKTEFEIVKEHAQKSYEILKGMAFPWPVAEAAWQHHERLDGSGYPRRLKGDEIILEARILAVADTVEAMASHRPYRPGHGVDAALAEIVGYRGTRFDAAVVDACLRLFRVKGYRLPV